MKLPFHLLALRATLYLTHCKTPVHPRRRVRARLRLESRRYLYRNMAAKLKGTLNSKGVIRPSTALAVR